MALREYVSLLVNEIPHDLYVIAFVILCAGFLMFVGLNGIRKGGLYTITLLLFEYVFFVFCSTVVFRETKHERSFDFTPFWSYEAIYDGRAGLLVEIIMNIIAFIPIGVLLGIDFSKWSWGKILIIGISISISIEVSQYFFKRGFSEVDDVIHNTLGCAIGFGFYKLVHWLFKRI